MDTAELNTLLNCIATPWIGADDQSSDLETPQSLTFKNWRPSDRGSLDEAVLERLYESMAPELDAIQISGMQDAQGSNFKDQLATFFSDMVSQSTHITHALFFDNMPTSDQTLQVVTALQESPSNKEYQRILWIDLNQNDFSNDETCQKLADIINDNISLRNLQLTDQVGTRQIYVSYTAATDAETQDGLIEITDVATQEVIVSMTTSRDSDLLI